MRLKGFLTTAAIIALGVATSGCGAIVPQWNVYVKQKNGEANLAESIAGKQVAVQQAKAKAEAATYEAEAEVTRAQGLAKAIQITGTALQTNPEYLRYLYVNNLAESKDQIIYVPTEAGLPILEAGRHPVAKAGAQ